MASSSARCASFAGACRFVFNKALALQKENHEAGGKFIGYVAMAKHLTAWRNGIRTFYYDVASDNDRIIRHLKLLGATHAGRADNIDRLELPVYRRAWDVPDGNDIARRFAEVFVRLQRSEALAA